jgi:hypothetical protein
VKEKEPIPSELEELFGPQEDPQLPVLWKPASSEVSPLPPDVVPAGDVPVHALPATFEDPSPTSRLSWNSFQALAADLDVDVPTAYRNYKRREGLVTATRSPRQAAGYVNPPRTGSWNKELYGYWEGMGWAKQTKSGEWLFMDRGTGAWITEAEMDRAHVIDAVVFDKAVKGRAAQLERDVSQGRLLPEDAAAVIRDAKSRFMHNYQNFVPQAKSANRSEGARLGMTYEETMTYLDAIETKLLNVSSESAAGPVACFVAGTTIQTSSGARAIDHLAARDQVLSFDPVSGLSAEQRVRSVLVRTVARIVDIQVADTVVTCSPEHPFWVSDIGWRTASTLKPGDALFSKTGQAVHVRSIRSREGTFLVFNLEVDGTHTYQVSPLAILVHNKSMNLAERAGLSGQVLTEMRAEAAQLAEDAPGRAERLAAIDDLARQAADLEARVAKAAAPGERIELSDDIAALEERIAGLGPESTSVRSASASANEQLTSLEARAHATLEQINDIEPSPNKAVLKSDAEQLRATLKDLREIADGSTPEELEQLIQPELDKAEGVWREIEQRSAGEPRAATSEAPAPVAQVGAVAEARIQPNVPVIKQLAGRGQLRDLRTNPNLAGVDIEELIKKTPAELEAMQAAGQLTRKTLRQIMKAFEGRDLGKRGRG